MSSLSVASTSLSPRAESEINLAFQGCTFRFFAGFDRNRDPILHMYSTYHPCILLDYLPGTLFAQPLFDLSVLLYQVVAVLALVRTVWTTPSRACPSS